MGNSMDSKGMEWPIIALRHSKRKEEPVRIQTGKRDPPGFQQDGRRRGC